MKNKKIIHKMRLKSGSFNKIKNGKKIIEVRLCDGKRKKLKLGDLIEFRCLPNLSEKIRVEVTALLKYKKFSELINDFPSHYFGVKNKKDIIEELYNFYTKEKEKKYKVLGIRLRLIRQ